MEDVFRSFRFKVPSTYKVFGIWRNKPEFDRSPIGEMSEKISQTDLSNPAVVQAGL